MTDQTAATECAFADEGCTCGRPRLTLTEAQARMAATPKPGPTFATYLDRHDRDQLDARAATAEAERDDALADRDEAIEARDVARQTAAFRQGVIDRHRQELGAAGDVLAVVRDAAERIDRALATYDTVSEPTPPDNPTALRTAARHLRLLADDHAADSLGFGIGWAADALDAWAKSTDEAAPPSSVPPRRAQETPLTAAHLAEHLYTHQWYSKPEFPLLHEPSAHREHIYNSDCAICRGDLSRIAAVALAYVQARL